MASQSSPVQLTPDSPVCFKSVHSDISYQSGLLEDARRAVLRDLGSSIPEIPFQTFLNHLAPPQPNFDLEGTMRSLKAGPQPALTSSNEWSKFPQAPKEALHKEDVVFRPMPEIFMEVVLAIIANSSGDLDQDRRTVDFLQDPNRAPKSVGIYNESRPDGFFVLRDRKTVAKVGEKEDINWTDIALTCEYKRKDGHKDLDNNVGKCVWNLQQTMREDMRRRATFGITIQNFTTRVWFCCRSWVVVSKAFDFMKEPGNLVKLFAAFAFANEDSLGFDPTIRPVPGRNGQFIITVHPDDDGQTRRFQTTKILSSHGAEPLRGRGTRVFEAVEIDGNGLQHGPHVVVKDIWIDSDRTREGNILDLLHAAADEEDKLLVEKYLLTKICHGDVWTNLGILDDTANALMRGLDVEKDHKSFFTLQRMPFIQNNRTLSGSDGLPGVTRAQTLHAHRPYSHKTHYRVVFKEIGTTLDRIKDLPDVMKILAETVSALRLLRKLGWVHRDVSIGNILSCGGHAKLADLEYAKKRGDLESHVMRTGTLHFMSIEAAAHRFLFRSRPEPSSTEIDDVMDQDDETETAQTEGATQTELPFFHNHLHDLESLWWVAVWVVFHNYFSERRSPRGSPIFTLDDVEVQIGTARDLFPLSLESTTRQNSFQTPDLFQVISKRLPNNKKAICKRLDILRRLLVKDYKTIEAGYTSVDPSLSDDDIYDIFTRVFSKSATDFHNFVLDFIPKIRETLLKEERTSSKGESSKRSRSGSINDTGISQKSQRK